MDRRLRRPLAVVFLLCATTVGVAPAVGRAGECPAADCQFGVCFECGRFCRLTTEPTTEKETCYDVECTEVCIPAVRFPWQSCCTPRCGRVRLVQRLKTESRKKPACHYEWQPLCPACRTRQVARERITCPEQLACPVPPPAPAVESAPK